MREHVHQRVEAELADLAADEVIQPRLGHAELLRGFALSRPTDDIANSRHQLRAKQQVFRLGADHVSQVVSAYSGSG